MILLIRGAPGVGKSTVAARLVARLGGAPVAAVVEVDELRGDLWYVPPALVLPEADRHHLAIAGAAQVALALLDVGVEVVVVVDTFAPFGVEAFAQALRGRTEVRSVTLIVEVGEHAYRLATRPEVPGVYRDLDVASMMNAELAAGEGVRIDTTGADPTEVAAQIAALLTARDRRIAREAAP